MKINTSDNKSQNSLTQTHPVITGETSKLHSQFIITLTVPTSYIFNITGISSSYTKNYNMNT